MLRRRKVQDEDELRRVLLQLQVAEFLYETRLIPKAAYTFKHALTQEVAYSSLLLDLYWAMDMTFWLPEAQAALAQSGSALALPQHRELRQSSGWKNPILAKPPQCIPPVAPVLYNPPFDYT
jgi:hypothetical protein